MVQTSEILVQPFKIFDCAFFDTPHSMMEDTFKNSLEFPKTASNGLRTDQTSEILVQPLNIFVYASFDTPHSMIKDTFKNGL